MSLLVSVSLDTVMREREKKVHYSVRSIYRCMQSMNHIFETFSKAWVNPFELNWIEFIQPFLYTHTITCIKTIIILLVEGREWLGLVQRLISLYLEMKWTSPHEVKCWNEMKCCGRCGLRGRDITSAPVCTRAVYRLKNCDMIHIEIDFDTTRYSIHFVFYH